MKMFDFNQRIDGSRDILLDWALRGNIRMRTSQNAGESIFRAVCIIAGDGKAFVAPCGVNASNTRSWQDAIDEWAFFRLASSLPDRAVVAGKRQSIDALLSRQYSQGTRTRTKTAGGIAEALATAMQ